MTAPTSCKLCSQTFTDPRLLPCLHIFCKSCLESLESQNEGTLTCPTCYKTGPHPPDDLPRHLRIEREVAISRIQEGGEGVVCGSCDESNKVEAYCEDCSSGICSDCVGMHKRLKALKSHVVFTLDSAELHSASAKQHISCTAHPSEVVKYYCISCSILVCSECVILDHKEHNCKNMKETGVEVRAKLQSVLPEVEKAIPPLSEAVEKINSIAECISSKRKSVVREVNEAFGRISAAVEKRRLEVLQEVKNVAVAKTNQLEEQKEGLEKIISGIQLSIDSGRVACSEYSTVEILAVENVVHCASKSLLEESCSFNTCPVNNSSLRFEINSCEVIKGVASLGSVQTIAYNPACNPAHCSLVDVNCELSVGVAKGCESVFMLQTRNSKGENLTVGGAEVRGQVSSGSEASECRVDDLDNGRYEIRFDNPIEGHYQLNITIDNVSISGCPCTVYVRDYTSIKSPIASVETKSNPAYLDTGPGNLQYVSTEGGSIETYKSNNMVNEIPQSKIGEKCSLRGIAVDKQSEFVFVADTNAHRIIKTSLNSELITSVGKVGSGELEFYWPWGLCLTEGNILLVGDTFNKRVQVLGSDLSFICSIPCQTPVYGVSVDSMGNIHAAIEGRVEVFTITGDKVTEYGEGILDTAGDVAFLTSQSRYSFVTDYSGGSKVFIFDWSKDTLVHSFTAVSFPLGININQEGTIFVSCFQSRQIQMF